MLGERNRIADPPHEGIDAHFMERDSTEDPINLRAVAIMDQSDAARITALLDGFNAECR